MFNRAVTYLIRALDHAEHQTIRDDVAISTQGLLSMQNGRITDVNPVAKARNVVTYDVSMSRKEFQDHIAILGRKSENGDPKFSIIDGRVECVQVAVDGAQGRLFMVQARVGSLKFLWWLEFSGVERGERWT